MSVLRVYQNPIAMNSVRNLKITGMATSKTLERMSSGLRINRAADDAAGLSISEKLRGQIRGLNRASSNALDGISLIQTAEGALNETHSILQRMRELAVQAANGIYTAEDRTAIQSEVSQLTDEINRIAKTTEFNTKTLLDGTMGALISTDDFTRVRAAVTGDVGEGGNFVLKAAAKSAGVLEIQKTDVFSTTQAGTAVGKINYLGTWRADATVRSASASGVGATGLYQVEVPVSGGGSIAVNSNVDGRLVVRDASIAAGNSTLNTLLQTEELTNGDKMLMTVETSLGGVQTFSVALSFNMSLTGLAAQISSALGTLVSGGGNGVNFGATGNFSINFNGNGRVLTTKFVDYDGSGSDFYLSFGNASGSISSSNFFFSSATYSFFNNNAVAVTGQLAGQRTTGSQGGNVFSIGDANTGQVHLRFDTRYNWGAVSTATTTASDIIGWNRYSGGNSFQDYGKVWQAGPAPANGTFLVSALSERTYAVFEFDNQRYTSLVASGTDQTIALVAARGSRVSNAAGAQTFSISETFAGAAGDPLENIRFTVDGNLQTGETATFNMSTNNVLTADQTNTLASLNRFQQFGVFDGRKNVEFNLYLRGSSRSATVTLSQNDTFEDMAGKISLAVWNPDGSGVVNSGILNANQAPDLVHVNTIGAAKGTMSITTPVPGAELIFSGDEALLKALSLVQVREGQAPVYSISAFNLEKNKSVGSTVVDSNEITGLVPGLRIFFDNTLGLRLDSQPPVSLAGGTNTLTSFGYQMATERPTISLSGQIESFFVHVAPRGFDLQIGANQGQTISSFIADMSAEALGVEGLIVAESPLAQEAITIIDVAIDRVSTQRSRLGAIQNRLESTIRNLDVASENLSSSESRIRDVDVAQETLSMTRNQILMQAGTAALAQANQLPQAAIQLLGR